MLLRVFRVSRVRVPMHLDLFVFVCIRVCFCVCACVCVCLYLCTFVCASVCLTVCNYVAVSAMCVVHVCEVLTGLLEISGESRGASGRFVGGVAPASKPVSCWACLEAAVYIMRGSKQRKLQKNKKNMFLFVFLGLSLFFLGCSWFS